MKSNQEYLEDIYIKQREEETSKKKYEFYNICFKKNPINPIKIAATFILIIGVTVGVGYAGNVAYQNIWKEPEKHTFSSDQKLTEEEIAKCISKEEAEKIGNEYLQKIGLEGDKIQNQELTKEIFSDENEWSMTSKSATISLDAETGDLKTVQVPTWNYRIPYHYGITRQEARNKAEELFEKFKPEDIEGDYELVKLTRNMETDEASYIWYAQFNKKYGDLINPYEQIVIGWIPTIDKVYQLSIKRGKFENNEQIITKEEAIEIAKNQDKEIEPDREIKQVDAQLGIEQMNEEAYLRKTQKEAYESGQMRGYSQTYYTTEERVRKVWEVSIHYKKSEEENLQSFTYFVDVTTGEIIGGATFSPTENRKEVAEDLYNLIEK